MEQTESMSDIEVQPVSCGEVGRISAPIRAESGILYRYIAGTEYSDWKPKLYFEGGGGGEPNRNCWNPSGQAVVEEKVHPLAGLPVDHVAILFFKLGFLDRSHLLHERGSTFSCKTEAFELSRGMNL